MLVLMAVALLALWPLAMLWAVMAAIILGDTRAELRQLWREAGEHFLETARAWLEAFRQPIDDGADSGT